MVEDFNMPLPDEVVNALTPVPEPAPAPEPVFPIEPTPAPVEETPAAPEEITEEEDCGCANTVSMVDWLKAPVADPEEECRPCALPVVCSWYEDELKEQGKTKLAAELAALRESEGVTPEMIAEELDKIKSNLKGELKERLKEFDCSCQLNM